MRTGRIIAQRVPDFFVVGSPKAGTTSLYHMLRGHPEVFMPALKEPRFLADDMRPRSGFSDSRHDAGYPTTLEQYLELFADAGGEQRVGEASTFYLWSRSAAARIAELQPDARIVAILREPASFLRSLHFMYMNWHVETERSLREAIALEPVRRDGEHIPPTSHRPQLLQYSEHVRYVEQLNRYYEHFSPERVLVLIYDDFRSDNEAAVRRILRFIEVDDQVPIDLMNVNVTKRTMARSDQLDRALRSTSMGGSVLARSAKATVKSLTTQPLRRAALRTIQRRNSVAAPPPPPDERLMVELRERFKPEVVALSELLGRDLVSQWGYDRLA